MRFTFKGILLEETACSSYCVRTGDDAFDTTPAHNIQRVPLQHSPFN